MKMIEYGGYLPPEARRMDIANRVLTFQQGEEELEIHMPYPSSEQLTQLTKMIKASPIQCLHTTDLMKAIDKTVHLLLDRTHPLRQKAEKLLPIITGYNAEVVRLGLTQSLQTFREHELRRWLNVNFQQPHILDQFEPSPHGGFTKAISPQLTTHIWAGNVPGLPLWSFIASLLVKGGVVGKVASAEPFFIGLFCQVLAEVEPRLANAMAIVSWQGGDQAREKALFRASDVVVGYGTNQTIINLQAQIVAPTRFISFGHKLSFGLLLREALDHQKSEKFADQAALDIVRYDQQGCYSPQTFFVERRGRTTPKEWAELLARKLQVYEERYPLRKLSMEEASERIAWRDAKEWQESAQVFSSKVSAWMVAYEEKLSLEPSPLSRTVHVIAVDDWQEVLDVLQDKRDILQTVGVGASVENLFAVATALSRYGITRVTSIGKMTKLHPGWHQDGYSLLRELVQLIDIDPATIRDLEALNTYTD